jgi:hypothetical protein
MLTLNKQDVDFIFDRLGEAPARLVLPVIDMMRQRINEQHLAAVAAAAGQDGDKPALRAVGVGLD